MADTPEATPDDAPAGDDAAAAAPAATDETAAPAAQAAADESAPAAEAATDETPDGGGASDGTGDEAAGEDAAPEVDLEALQRRVASPPSDARYQATGKRKTSVARVIVTPGDGTFWINGRTLEEYFPRFGSRTAIMEPFVITGAVGAYNVRARIHGGGIHSQAGALRHGLARALAEIDPVVRTQLKSKGLLKLDARQVERKKAGLKKARKRPQFSKR